MMFKKSIVISLFLSLFLFTPFLAHSSSWYEKGTVRIENDSEYTLRIYINGSYQGELRGGDTKEYIQIDVGEVRLHAERKGKAMRKSVRLDPNETVEWVIDWEEIYDRMEDFKPAPWEDDND